MEAPVSVVIPAYNCGEFIRDAITSALNQSLEPLEVVVVDDYSRDSTPRIVEAISRQNPKVKFYRNEKNMERSYTRNRGVRMSRGEYVCFLDCDDVWMEDHVAQMVDLMRGAKGAFAMPYGFVDREGRLLKVKKPFSGSFEEALFSGRVGYPSGSCFERETFLQVGGYDEALIQREDWEIFLRLFVRGVPIGFLPRGRYLIREHGRRSSQGNPAFLKHTLDIYEKYFPLVDERYRGYLLFHMAEQCFRFRQRKCGWRFLLKLLKDHPSVLARGRWLWELVKRMVKV